MVSELKRDLGRVMVISDDVTFAEADWNFTLGRKCAPEVVALYGVMLMYGLAYYQALRSGVNPDHPAEGDPTRPDRGEGFIRTV